MSAEKMRLKEAALERYIDRSSKEKDVLRKALKIASDAIDNAALEVFPSRKGHYKRDAASRASGILEVAAAQLRALELPMHPLKEQSK